MILSAALAALCLINGASALRVSGNRFINDQGQTVILQGFSHSGTEFQCVNWGTAIFDGPNDDSSIQKMLEWKVNAVRIPLNEHCWLGINGVSPQQGGENYKRAVGDYV